MAAARCCVPLRVRASTRSAVHSGLPCRRPFRRCPQKVGSNVLARAVSLRRHEAYVSGRTRHSGGANCPRSPTHPADRNPWLEVPNFWASIVRPSIGLSTVPQPHHAEPPSNRNGPLVTRLLDLATGEQSLVQPPTTALRNCLSIKHPELAKL
jgi:hypothetical protein